MAKSATADQTIYFKGKEWAIGDKSGLYAQVVRKEPLKNLDVAREVVNVRRFPHSPEEVLNVFTAVVDVMTQKTGTDLRPRIIEGYIKTDVSSGGSMDNIKSPWDKTKNWCKIAISLLKDSTKLIDGSFRNVETALIPELNFVTALGSDIQNTIDLTADIVAYGNRMQFNAELGDLAWLEDAHGEKIPLVCTSSDVAQAVFTFPTSAAAYPAGTKLTFHMVSRGGEVDGIATPLKKEVVIAEYRGTPVIAYFSQEGKDRNEFGVDANAVVTVKGAGFTNPNVLNVKLGKLAEGGNTFTYSFTPTNIRVVDANTLTCKLPAAEEPDQTDEQLAADSAAGNIVLRLYTQTAKSNDLVARYVA